MRRPGAVQKLSLKLIDCANGRCEITLGHSRYANIGRNA
jgi:hypothetical protein